MENTKKVKLSQKTWFIWFSLVVFAPLGIFLLWKNKKYNVIFRVLLSLLFAFLFISIISAFNSSSNDTTTQKSVEVAQKNELDDTTPKSTATPAPTKSPTSQNNENTSSKVTSSDNSSSKGSNNTVDNVKDKVLNIVDSNNKYVLGVKNATPDEYPGKTYEKAFSSFFGSPTWKYFKADSGESVVEFTGFCTYEDTEVKARLQFIISNDGNTFEIGALSFNDVPQNQLITSALLEKAFSSN